MNNSFGVTALQDYTASVSLSGASSVAGVLGGMLSTKDS